MPLDNTHPQVNLSTLLQETNLTVLYDDDYEEIPVDVYAALAEANIREIEDMQIKLNVTLSKLADDPIRNNPALQVVIREQYERWMRLKEALNWWASDSCPKEFGGPLLEFRFKKVATKMHGNATLTDDVLFDVRGGDLAYSLDDLREDIYDFVDHVQSREHRKIKGFR